MRDRANARRLSHEWYEKNKARVLRELKERYHADPVWAKEKGLKHYYGITYEQFVALLNSQNGSCAICLEPLKEGRGTNVDHDHTTKQVRGLLCHKCNLLLGHSNDSIEILKNAIAYLRRTTCAT